MRCAGGWHLKSYRFLTGLEGVGVRWMLAQKRGLLTNNPMRQFRLEYAFIAYKIST